jgi:hypothetical protein
VRKIKAPASVFSRQPGHPVYRPKVDSLQPSNLVYFCGEAGALALAAADGAAAGAAAGAGVPKST